MTILHIETSTNVCSVAVSDNGICVFEKSNNEGLNHAEMLSPFIDEALNEIGNLNLNLDAIAVSGGPGSYTGLRIGVSTAKGLCYGFEIPLIVVDTLQILCEHVIANNKFSEDSILCPMLDARRMEVYTALYSPTSEKTQDVSAVIITENSFLDILEKHTVYFFGNGSAKCESVITHPHAVFLPDVELLAKDMIRIAEQKYVEKDFADVAYFEPFYLKEFQVTTPKKLL
jgi:tRNA threonylcarbamoyladenosine biosynthesis protein TsaB